jgi:PAS domain S-box-containing protein
LKRPRSRPAADRVSDTTTRIHRPKPQRERRGDTPLRAPEVMSGDRALALGRPVSEPSAEPAQPATRAAFTAAPGLAYFEECPDAILRFNAEQRVVYANPAVERATAVSRWQFIEHRLEEVEHFADFAPLWNESLAAVIETHEGRWFKFSYPHPTGAKLFDVRLQVETGVEPGHTHVTAVLRDITVPKSALRATRAAAEFVESLLASASIGIGVLDRNCVYRVWNEHLETLLGVAAEAVLGRAFDDAPGLSTLAGLNVEVQRLAGEVARVPVEVEARYPAAERPWLRVKLTPVFDPTGHFDGDALRGLALALIDAGLGERGFEALHEQLRSRGAYQGEATYRTRFGSTFPVEVVVQRIEQGGREFILLLARDATERKRAEEALTESAERFRALFDESPVAALLLDAGFRVIGVNRAASATVGYTIEELTGRDPEMFVLADDQLGYSQMRERLLGGTTQSEATERRLVHRDSSLVWTKANVRAVAAGSGLRHYLVVLENFTDRKIFEEQLQVALRDQQTLFETMSVGVAQTMSGKIMLANREFADMFGYRDGQVIGMPLWDLTIDRDNRMPNEISGMPVVRANQTTSGEVVLFRKDGEPIWCLVQARPIQSEAPGAEGLREAIYTFQNVSEMKRQREALSRSLLELNVVLDATSMGVLHLQDDRVVRCNAQAQVMFGHPGSALVFCRVRLLRIHHVAEGAACDWQPGLVRGPDEGAQRVLLGAGVAAQGRRQGRRQGNDRVDPRYLGAQEAGRRTADRAGAAATHLRHRAGGAAVRARRPAGTGQQCDGGVDGLRSGRARQPDAALYPSDRSPAARESRRALSAYRGVRGVRVRAVHVPAQSRPDLGRGAGSRGQCGTAGARLHLRLRQYRRAQALRA